MLCADARLCVRVRVSVWGLCVLLGLQEEGEELMEGGCGQDYCSAIIPRPSQRCSHEPGGLWVLLVPTENGGVGEGQWGGGCGGGKGAGGVLLFAGLFPQPSASSSPPSSSKVFIDYLVPLLNNLMLGDSALCSHRN